MIVIIVNNYGQMHKILTVSNNHKLVPGAFSS